MKSNESANSDSMLQEKSNKSVALAILSGMKKPKPTREGKPSKAAKNIIKIWRDTLLKYYPSLFVPDYSTKLQQIFKRISIRAETEAKVDFVELVEWTILNWYTLEKHTGDWQFTKCPYPDIQIFCYKYDSVINAYLLSKKSEVLNNGSDSHSDLKVIQPKKVPQKINKKAKASDFF